MALDFYIINDHNNPMLVGTIDELVENFSLFDEWEERYRYLIDIGRELPHLADEFKRDEFLVRGCTSRVWLIPKIEHNVFTFQADSDAHIVRGLVAILYIAYQGKSCTDIMAIKIEDLFTELGMDKHLSANRRSGFFSMVERVRSLIAQNS